MGTNWCSFIQAGNLTSFQKPDPQELNNLLEKVLALNESARDEITVADNPRLIERRADIARDGQKSRTDKDE